ncbi:MAG: LysR family transcriptional regulator, partial [Rhodobacteraceae bacterium]|nr:LysR family transcriptional regulator [Paracoccaceae bacterium]
AETGTAVAAGDKLNVSHAAISQQIKALEAHMGVALVDRSGRGLVLTDAGAQLAEALSSGFGTIARSIEALTGADADRALHISTTPLFASGWLMPQMAGFHAQYPGANLIISTTPKLEPLEPGGVDVALRYGDGNWSGLDSTPLLISPMVLVGAPSLVGEAPFSDPSELAHFPLLEDFGITEASDWLRQSGVAEQGKAGLVQLPGNLLLDAARDGRGVAVAIRFFVENDLQSGRLRLLFENDNGKGYHIVTRPGVQRPALKTFLTWLRRCARDCMPPQ